MEKRYQVFVSSTLEDLKNERSAVIEGLLQAKYIPAAMEYFPATNEDQFTHICKEIDSSDFYALIIGERYGSVPPDGGKSYTERELDYALERQSEGKLRVFAFLLRDPKQTVNGDPSDKAVFERERQGLEKLKALRERAKEGRIIKFWKDAGELAAGVKDALHEAERNNPESLTGWVRGGRLVSKETLTENARLQKELGMERKEKWELEEQLANLKKKLVPGMDDIGKISDSIYVKGTYKLKDSKKDIVWVLPISIRSIFLLIAPTILEPKDDNECIEIIKDEIISRYYMRIYNKYIIPKNIFKIDEECICRVRDYLQEFHLIDLLPWRPIYGFNRKGVVPFWALTEKGKKVMKENLVFQFPRVQTHSQPECDCGGERHG